MIDVMFAHAWISPEPEPCKLKRAFKYQLKATKVHLLGDLYIYTRCFLIGANFPFQEIFYKETALFNS